MRKNAAPPPLFRAGTPDEPLVKGDVKRLRNFTPAYRLRVGDYRVLFAVEGGRILVHRVVHRREAYDR